MKNINLVASLAAFVAVVYVTPSVAADNTWYTELAVGYSDPESPNYRFKNGVEKVPLDTDYSARLTVGRDFGKIRGDIRLQYFQIGNPSTIGSTTVINADVHFLTAMINGTYDIEVHEKVTPFISLGAGVAGGRGEGTTFSSTGVTDSAGGKASTEVGNRVVAAPAVRAGLGVALNLSDTVSLVMDYDYLYNFASEATGKIDDFDIQTGSVGLRIHF